MKILNGIPVTELNFGNEFVSPNHPHSKTTWNDRIQNKLASIGIKTVGQLVQVARDLQDMSNCGPKFEKKVHAALVKEDIFPAADYRILETTKRLTRDIGWLAEQIETTNMYHPGKITYWDAEFAEDEAKREWDSHCVEQWRKDWERIPVKLFAKFRALRGEIEDDELMQYLDDKMRKDKEE